MKNKLIVMTQIIQTKKTCLLSLQKDYVMKTKAAESDTTPEQSIQRWANLSKGSPLVS